MTEFVSISEEVLDRREIVAVMVPQGTKVDARVQMTDPEKPWITVELSDIVLSSDLTAWVAYRFSHERKVRLIPADLEAIEILTEADQATGELGELLTAGAGHEPQAVLLGQIMDLSERIKPLLEEVASRLVTEEGAIRARLLEQVPDLEDRKVLSIDIFVHV